MSKNKNQNKNQAKNQTNLEERNRQLVNALYEQKLVKPTCSDCENYYSVLAEILVKRGFEQEGFDRELHKCEEKMKKCFEDSANPYSCGLCIIVRRVGCLRRLMLRRPEARITIHGLITCTVMT